MLIVCPSCASAYSLNSEQLGEGRQLRCAKCRQQWFATPADAVEESEIRGRPDADALTSLDAPVVSPDARDALRADPRPAEEQPAPEAEPRRPAPGRRRTEKPKKATGRVRLSSVHAAAAALLIVAVLAATQRAAIVRILPQTARLYAAVGAPV